MHSAIWTARTSGSVARTNRALSSLTHESSQNFGRIPSSSERDPGASLANSFRVFEKPVDAKEHRQILREQHALIEDDVPLRELELAPNPHQVSRLTVSASSSG